MEKSTQNHARIKEWSEDDRPREKLVTLGKQNLSNAELLAIVIGSGNREESAVQLSQRILAEVNNQFSNLSRLTIPQLTSRFKGIGVAKAISIQAALEIGRRRSLETDEKGEFVRHSKDAYQIIAPLISDCTVEIAYAIYLNKKNKVIDKKKIGEGGTDSCIIDPKIILQHALLTLAAGIIIFHNHPSGNLQPSKVDIRFTERLKAGCDVMDIKLMDHLIIAENGYYSFADEGLL
jgi:DNA repair protein RadC